MSRLSNGPGDSAGAGRPRVTVGVLAYNEEQYIENTLESILEQDFADCEILVADNASVDRTAEIVARVASRDGRIHSYRQPRNIGALQNLNSLIRKARGEFFVMAGGHDLWSEGFLAKLTRALERRPDAVLAYAPTVMIDEEGEPTGEPAGFVDTGGLSPVARFNSVLWGNQNALYGLYRTDALRKTRLQLEILGSGAVMLGELALMGDFAVVPEATWFRRMVRRPESHNERVGRYFGMLFSSERRRLLPHWRIPLAFVQAALRAELKPATKAVATVSAAGSVFLYGPSMLADLAVLVSRPSNLFKKTSGGLDRGRGESPPGRSN